MGEKGEGGRESKERQLDEIEREREKGLLDEQE